MNADNTLTLADFQQDLKLAVDFPPSTIINHLNVTRDFLYDEMAFIKYTNTPCQTIWLYDQAHDQAIAYIDFPLNTIIVIRESQL